MIKFRSEKIFESILEKIKNRNLRLTVIGGGYVGLPTAALFSNVGFFTVVCDVQPKIIEALQNGCTHINEPGLKPLIYRNVKANRLNGKLNNSNFQEADVILIAVQTPINEEKKPDLTFLYRVLNSIRTSLRLGTLVIVNSTIPPGTTLQEIKPLLEASSGLKADVDFYLAYVPERIAPGKALNEFTTGTRLVGGVGPNSTRVAAELFRTICKTVIETDATTAEISKLAENTYRDINIAFANELAMICEGIGVDAKEIINLANTHPRVNIHNFGPGVGGPCIPKDPYFLLQSFELPRLDLIKRARKINDYMSLHLLSLILKSLKDIGKKLENTQIVVLGVGYKKDADDSRFSPAEPIIRELVRLGIHTRVYDPFCLETFGAEGTNSLEEALTDADCLVSLTDHTEFLNMDLQKIKRLMADKPVVVDGRRIIDPTAAKKLGFRYYGLGLSISKE